MGPLACVTTPNISTGTHSRPGDSGGVWYYGTTAFGIHSAGNYQGGAMTNGHISCMAQVNHALYRLQLSLWTG